MLFFILIYNKLQNNLLEKNNAAFNIFTRFFSLKKIDVSDLFTHSVAK